MVAEAALILVAVEGAAGFPAAVGVLWLQEEGGIVDVDAVHSLGQGRGEEDVVEGVPFAAIAVGALCTACGSCGLGADVEQACLLECRE